MAGPVALEGSFPSDEQDSLLMCIPLLLREVSQTGGRRRGAVPCSVGSLGVSRVHAGRVRGAQEGSGKACAPDTFGSEPAVSDRASCAARAALTPPRPWAAPPAGLLPALQTGRPPSVRRVGFSQPLCLACRWLRLCLRWSSLCILTLLVRTWCFAHGNGPR